MYPLRRMALLLCFASALFQCGSEFEILLDDSRAAIYWTDSGGAIKKIYSDGTERKTVVSLESPRVPLDVAMDLAGGKLYWTEYTGSRFQIRRVGLDGSGEELYIDYSTSPNHGPTAIAIDPVDGKIYWNRYRDGTDYINIYRADLTVPVTGQESWWSYPNPPRPYLYSISIDAINRKLYYTGGSYWDINNVFGSGNSGRVYRGDMNTIDSVEWEPIGYGLTSPSIPFRGIAVDGSAGYTYYVDYTTAALSIQRADLVTRYPTVWVTASGFEIQKIALDLKRRKIYWTSITPNGIYRADLDSPNSHIEQFLPLADTPTGIAVAP